MTPVLEALKSAAERDPQNAVLWQHFADLALQEGVTKEALHGYRKCLELGTNDTQLLLKVLPLLRESGHWAEALIRVEQALQGSDDPNLRLEHVRVLIGRNDLENAARHYAELIQTHPDFAVTELSSLLLSQANAEPATADASSTMEEGHLIQQAVEGERCDVDQLLEQFRDDADMVRFADVAGLDTVKKQINLKIIAPFKKASIFSAFQRRGGGGILLYGPPGCGKTYIARATAGECGARFVNVGIHDVIDKYWGESEKMIHRLFDDARRNGPTVLFFDEFDALGSTRGRSETQFWKTLVDQLLQEMDGIERQNHDVLIFAATNMPWNVDSAFRRPGRFDRVVFVPTPDAEARKMILSRYIGNLPGGNAVPLDPIVQRTELFSGADLRNLCERASDAALSRSLETDEIHPVSQTDFFDELKVMRSSVLEWFSMARNYARYANDGGIYDELNQFLKKNKLH